MCISQARSTWGIQLSENLKFEASADQRLETWAFKVVRENSGYMCSMYPPHIFTIFQNFQRSVEPRHWQVTTRFIKFEPVPIYLELSFILFAKFLPFFDGNTWSKKNFKIQNFFYIFWKVWTINTLSLNSWVVEAYISIRLENGYIPEKKQG